MTPTEKRELENQVIDLFEEGPTSDRMGRLSQLLTDRPDLQCHYARYVFLNSQMLSELNSLLYSPAEMSHCDTTQPRRCAASDSPRQGQQHLSSSYPERRSSGTWLRSRPLLYAVGCTMVAFLVGYQLLKTGHPSSPRHVVMNVPSSSGMGPSESFVDKSRGFESDDEHNLLFISKATRTPTLTSLLLPLANADSVPATLFCSGTAWMEQESGSRDRGHLVVVPPGHSIDLLVDADSRLENNVFVFELDEEGRVNGNIVNFSNAGNRASVLGNFVDVGRWSQRNSSDIPRYFLITGSHQLTNRKHSSAEKSSWRLSDYKVWIDLPYLIFIGWDDSNYYPDKPSGGRADYDYDDICALVTITPPDRVRMAASKVKYVPASEIGNLTVECEEEDFEFVVPADTGMAIKVVSNAKYFNAVDFVAQGSNQVIWRFETKPRRGREAPPGTSVYYIENRSAHEHRYKIHAVHQRKGADRRVSDPWYTTAYKIVAEDESCTMIGYEDKPHKIPYDWNDIQIQLRRVPQLP